MGSHNIIKHRSKIMTSHHPEEKENIITEKMLPTEEIYRNHVDLNFSLFRRKIKTRLDRCQEILKKIDHDSRRMRICFLQLMDLVDNCKKIVKEEQEQNIHLLQLLEVHHPRKRCLSSKTQTVNPMIAGVPIKKASIMLKRLDPLQEISSFNNSRATSRNSPFNLPQTSCRRPLCESVQPINTDTFITPRQNRVRASSLSITLPNAQVRCERWSEPVSSPSLQEHHLKQASIHLIRLDPRLYIIPENGPAEVDGSENETFHELEIESSSFDPISSNTIPMNVETDEVNHDRNVETSFSFSSSLPSPCSRSTPLVVLKRLEIEESCTFLNNSKSRSSSVSSSSDDCKIIEVLPTNEEYFANKRKSTPKCQVNVIEGEDMPKSAPIGRSAAIKNCYKSQRITKNVNYGARKRVQNSKASANNNKRRKIDHRNKKKKLPEKEIDEDPLEGPSWLYKDGTTKNAKFKKLKRFREDYLTSFYYLPPTIYSSSEDSGDDQSNKERKSSKLRKRKNRRN